MYHLFLIICLQAWKLYERSRVTDLVDPKLREDGFVERDVLQAIHVALLCTQQCPSLRPPMSEIVAILTCKGEMAVIPMKPTYLERRRRLVKNRSWEPRSRSFSSLSSNSSSFGRPYQPLTPPPPSPS